MTQAPVTWDTSTETPSATGTISSNSFTGGGSGWNRISTNADISYTASGKVVYSVPTGGYMWVYLTDTPGSAPEGNANFGIYNTNNGASTYAVEDGGSEIDLSETWSSSDSLSIEIDPSTKNFIYKKNDVTIHTSSNTATTDLRPSCQAWTGDTCTMTSNADAPPVSTGTRLPPPPIILRRF